MADTFSKSKRSAVMAAIRSKRNASTEEKFAALLRISRIRGWRRNSQIPGKPDFVFPKERLAIFVDGCFWHACPQHGTSPKSNQNYWSPKLQRNVQRDRRINRVLKSKGWRVMRIWEHSLKSLSSVVRRVSLALTQTTGRSVSSSMPLNSRRLRSSKTQTPP